MAKLKKKQVNEINSFLKEKEFFHAINNYLLENNMSSYEVELIKLKPKVLADQKSDISNLICEPGFTKVMICTPSGKCGYQCVRI